MSTVYPPSGAQIEPGEPLELSERNAWVGSRVWAAAQAFFFIAFVFAFFYLRALNSNDVWLGWKRNHHPTPSLGLGVAVLICVVASAAIARGVVLFARASWRPAAIASLALGLAA